MMISSKAWMNIVGFPSFSFFAFGRVISDVDDGV